MRHLVAVGTGTQAVKETQTQKSPLTEIWADAARKGREALWRGLPDRAIEVIEDDPRGATPEDLNFLASRLEQPRVEAVAAVRLLASIGEDELAPIENVRALLVDFLEHHDPAVRVAVVEAFWQMADKAAAPQLEAALGRETHPEVRENIEHVLRLFR
jgi:HEAT repeat protein